MWIFKPHSKQVYGNAKDCKVSKEDYGLFEVSVQNNLSQDSSKFSYRWLLLSLKTQIRPYLKSYNNLIEDYHFFIFLFILGFVKNNKKLRSTLCYSNWNGLTILFSCLKGSSHGRYNIHLDKHALLVWTFFLLITILPHLSLISIVILFPSSFNFMLLRLNTSLLKRHRIQAKNLSKAWYEKVFLFITFFTLPIERPTSNFFLWIIYIYLDYFLPSNPTFSKYYLPC